MEVATNSDRAAHTSALISAFKSNAWIEHGIVHPQVTHMSIGRQLTTKHGARDWRAQAMAATAAFTVSCTGIFSSEI